MGVADALSATLPCKYSILNRSIYSFNTLAARRPPPTASAFAWRLGFCDFPSGGEGGVPERLMQASRSLPPGGGVGETRAKPAVEPVGGGKRGVP